MLDQVDGPVASFTADGAYDRDGVYGEVAARHPEAAVIVPPRSGAVPSETAETAPTRRDRHLQLMAERGRMGWQKASSYNLHALAEAAVSRHKRVTDDAALPHGWSSGDRGGHRRRHAEPHAGAWTPEVRPRRMNPDEGSFTAPAR